jgi:ubiquinone biosynthesis protein COQ9
MKDLGERIKQAIARIEAMQQELERRLKELEEVQEASDRLWKYAMDHKDDSGWTAYEAGQLLNDYIQGADIDREEVLKALEVDRRLNK